MSKICLVCGQNISEGRLKAIKDVKTCTSCSTTKAISGFMSWEHKTAPVLNICSQETANEIKKLANRHGGQGVSLGVKFRK